MNAKTDLKVGWEKRENIAELGNKSYIWKTVFWVSLGGEAILLLKQFKNIYRIKKDIKSLNLY